MKMNNDFIVTAQLEMTLHLLKRPCPYVEFFFFQNFIRFFLKQSYGNG